MMIKITALCSKSCMIYLAMTLSFLIVCRSMFKSALNLRLNVERLFEFWISCGRSFKSLIIDGTNDLLYN